MKRLGGALATVVRRRLFAKYIIVTLLLGTALNAAVLAFYYDRRQLEQSGRIATEITAVASRIARPAAALVRAGNDRQARELLAVFAAYPYTICADLFLDGGARAASSWPVIGCDRINKAGRDLAVPLPGLGADAAMNVRIDAAVLRAQLATEFLILVTLGALGGLALVLAGAAAFLWFIKRPLTLLLGAIEQFERHDDPRRVAYRSSDEIGRVVSGYNMMLEREVQRVSQVRDAHRSILDSVNYATRIQRGLLPTPARLAAAFDEASVLWQPRDLVGGDIYWVHRDGPRATAALIDCTGHGVPGGFMSMLAVATLERIFAEDDTPSPGKILTRLSDLTRRLLNQHTPDSESNDGMDAAVCQLDAESGEGVFAGARLSLTLCAGGRIERLRGNRVSLGYPDTPAGVRLDEVRFAVAPDTRLFLTTDGLIDQLGGPRRIAFGYRRFGELIKTGAASSLDDTLTALRREFEAYRGSETLLDDVTVLALKPVSALR